MRICFLGDSFVNGTNDPRFMGWPGRIAALAARQGRDLTVYNLGIRRDTSRDIAKRWRTEAALRLPAECDGRLVFSFGVNDCMEESGIRRVAPAESLENAAKILSEAKASHPTLMIGPPPIADQAANRRINALSEALAQICAKIALPYLAPFPVLVSSPVWMDEVAKDDGAHPGAVGYDLLADLIHLWPAWQDWLDQPR